MAMYNIKPDPSTAFVRNAYHRVGITDLDKIRDSAFDNVNKGISTILHLHTHGDECKGQKHEYFVPGGASIEEVQE